MSHPVAIHQLIGKSTPGYSVSNYALALQDALRSWGYDSTIYASEVDSTLGKRVQPLNKYRPHKQQILLLHYATVNEVTAWAKQFQEIPFILCYHNVTPSQFFKGMGGRYAMDLEQNIAELTAFKARSILNIAFSQYSAQTLAELGFANIKIQPLLMPKTLQMIKPDTAVINTIQTHPNLLFVGRIAPNKKCEDIIKLLYYYRQIEPEAKLYLVGPRRHTRPYAEWVQDFVAQYGMQDTVIFTGRVTDAQLAAYYRRADFFVMMSEHEGFGIPLIEAMRFDVPVLAYASTAVPETMGDAGILIQQKQYDVLAELLNQIHTQPNLRQAIIKTQQTHIQQFEPEKIMAEFQQWLKEIL